MRLTRVALATLKTHANVQCWSDRRAPALVRLSNTLTSRVFSALTTLALVSAAGCSDVTPPPTESRLASQVTAHASLTGGTGVTSPITSRLANSPCMDVMNGSRTAGTPMQIWNCYGGAAQTFAWMSDGSIRAYASSTPMCLNVSGSGIDGDRITISACNGSAQQRWSATPAGEIRGLNGKCLDVQNANPANGSKLLVWNCYGSPSQKWDNSVGNPPPPPPPPVPVATVSVALSPSTLPVSQTAQATATLRDASGNVLTGRTVVWSSSSAAVARVATTGLVTALTTGSATIVATSEGKSGSAGVTVTASVAGVPVFPGQSIQAAVNANPTGTTFIIKTGTHTQQSVVPKSGNVFHGEPGAVLDGQNVTQHAFRPGSAPFPSNVTIRGLKVTRYNSPQQSGAIQAGGHAQIDGSSGWVIENNEVSYNYDTGIRIGNSTLIRNNNIHHNRRINLAGVGNNTVIENNDISYGNHLRAHNINFEAGGTKFTNTNGLLIRNNNLYNNVGVAVHMDLNNINTVIEGNQVRNNDSEGIAIEVSYKTTIRNNIVTGNGFNDPLNRYTWLWNAGIGVHASPDVEIYGNTVSGNYNGITATQQDRSAEPAVYGPHILQNLYVHDNTVTMQSGQTGAVQDWGGTAVFTSRNNRWVNNRYILTGNGAYPFHWMNGSGRTEAQWRAYGMDVNGSFTR